MIHFTDPIHGHIEYPDIIFNCVDTEEFQRLRNIKQLGVNCWINPGASHTRFDHCLGVCHLADRFLSYLEKNSKISVSQFHRNCVMIAGLLHDVGHGPFSHMWEDFVDLKKHKDFNHEDTSCMMAREIFKNYNIKLSDDRKEQEAGIEIICALITGNLDTLKIHLKPEHMYLTEIVNNKICFIDIDKWDYIIRDAYYLNNVISISKGFENAFKGARVTRGADGQTHISYHYRHYPFVYELFEMRANLHMHCYKNIEVAGIEELITNTLVAAEDAGFLFKGVKMSEAHLYPNVYKFLDDTILEHIAISDDPVLKPAQQLIRRLKTRQLYTIVHTTNNDAVMNPLKKKLGNDYFHRCRDITSASETMPKNIILHDDRGDIVDQDVQNSNWFDRYILYSKYSLPQHKIEEIERELSAATRNGH